MSGLGKLGQIGLGVATGGIGGYLTAGSGLFGGSAAGNLMGAGSAGYNIYDKWNETPGAKDNPNYGSGQTPSWDQNNFGGQDFSDQLGAMGRKMRNYQFGGG